MPDFLLIPFIATIVYFFLPHHILSRSSSRTTWLIRGFILLNGLAYWVGSEPWFGTITNPLWQVALRFFFLETCYLCALGTLYSVKGWKMPRWVGAALIGFYAVWLLSSLILLQSSLPRFANLDQALQYTAPAFLAMRLAAVFSTLILFTELVRCLYRFWVEERFFAGKLRFGFLAIGVLLAFVNRLFVLAHIIALFATPLDFSNSVLAIEKTINLVATVFFIAGCLPPFMMARLARVLVYLDQQRAILELAVLRSALVSSTAPLPWPLPNWPTRLKEPTYVLYSSMIDVLDRIWLLESLPSATNSTLEGIQSLRDPLAPNELLERLRQMARRIYLERWTVRLRRILSPFTQSRTDRNVSV